MAWRSELREYLRYHRAKGTSDTYQAGIRNFVTRLGDRYDPDSFLSLSRAQLMDWFGELREKGKRGKPLSEATLKTASGHIRAFFRWLNEGESPPSLKGLSVGRIGPRIKAKSDFLTDTEFNRLVNASRPRDRVVYLIIRWTAARPSEVLNLRGRDVTPTPQGDYLLVFRQTKNGESREIPLIKREVVSALKDYLEIAQPGKDEALFPSPLKEGEPLQAASLWRAMTRVADSVGITRRIYPYMLRHKRATEAYRWPQGLRDKLLGWKSGVMWKNYEHLDTDDLADYLREEEGTEVPQDALARIEELEREVKGWRVRFEGFRQAMTNLREAIFEVAGPQKAKLIGEKLRDQALERLEKVTDEDLEAMAQEAR